MTALLTNGQNDFMTVNVRARLWNEERSYDVELALQVQELRGQRNVPDAYLIETSSLTHPRPDIQDGEYAIRYRLNGEHHQHKVRVATGRIFNTAQG